MKLPNTFRLGRNLEKKTAQLLGGSNIPSEDPLVSEGLEGLLEEYKDGFFDTFTFLDLIGKNGYNIHTLFNDNLRYYVRFKKDDSYFSGVEADILIKNNYDKPVSFSYVVMDSLKVNEFCKGHRSLVLEKMSDYPSDLSVKFDYRLLYASLAGGLAMGVSIALGILYFGEGHFKAYTPLGLLFGGAASITLTRMFKEQVFNFYCKRQEKKVKEIEYELGDNVYRWVKDSECALTEAFS
ncbi:MAG: hypothetical protein KKA79_03155 [Nanoarchaeota archaeon]|nr:hypothetical protein [Nanoarchaeota archaeon]